MRWTCDRAGSIGAVALAAVAGACHGRAPAQIPDVVAGREAVTPVARCTTSTPATRAVIRVLRDVAYAAPGGDTLRLDLALPAGAGPHPVVLLLHGGGWKGGGRESMHDEMYILAARGYGAATVTYRLTRARANVFPAAVQDARCAVRWLRAHAGAHGLDGARIGVFGFSAGAHLASMLGTTASVASLDTAADSAPSPECLTSGGSPEVQAVVSVAGPQDLRVRGRYTRKQARLVTNFLGVFPGDAPTLAALASPIAHVSASSAPFLLVQGTKDDLVVPEHARRMRDALQGAGVPATLLDLGGARHGLPALEGGEHPAMGCTVFAFFERWLRSDATSDGTR